MCMIVYIILKDRQIVKEGTQFEKQKYFGFGVGKCEHLFISVRP